MHPQRKGDATESRILHEFLRREIPVSIPFGDNERYDMVVESDGTFERVQCKTGRYKNGCVIFDCSNVNLHDGERHDYHGDIEYFAVYCDYTEEVYMLPVEETGRSEKSLRVEEPEQTSSRITWAEDYEIETFLQ